jgi:hypothetical protein
VGEVVGLGVEISMLARHIRLHPWRFEHCTDEDVVPPGNGYAPDIYVRARCEAGVTSPDGDDLVVCGHAAWRSMPRCGPSAWSAARRRWRCGPILRSRGVRINDGVVDPALTVICGRSGRPAGVCCHRLRERGRPREPIGESMPNEKRAETVVLSIGIRPDNAQ